MSDFMWRRLRYFLTPQWDLYGAIAPHLDGLTVLDIGCGTGFGSLQLARYAAHVNACDIDGDAIEFARASLQLPCLHFTQADITETAQYTEHDAALLVEVLEHISDWRLALERVRARIKPGGKLYMTARNANASLRRNDLHEREWTAQQLKGALGEFFPVVRLYDFRVTEELDDTTTITPLVAVCEKA